MAHFSSWGPNKCGLYHTARDMVLAERLVGIDAGFIAIDDNAVALPKQKDGNFESETVTWAGNADILVRHTCMPTLLHNSGKPVVMAMHGRPESSMRLEQQKNKIITSYYNKSYDARYKAFITFWPEYMDIWSNLIPPDRMFYVPAMVDLEQFKPDNEKFNLGDYDTKPNILIADLWREDITPFNTLFAAVKFVKKCGGKIHMAGIPQECLSAMAPFLTNLRNEGVLGHLFGQIKHIKNMYASADIFVTPHVIATRTIREALASGVPVVAGKGCRYTKFQANPMDIDAFAEAIEECWKFKDHNPRSDAEKYFNFRQAGDAVKKVFEKVLQKKGGGRKVFIDLGGHLGETVRRFYREVDDADEYEIFSFEPAPDVYYKLYQTIGHIKNVNLINAAAGKADGNIEFFPGSHNDGEGGTSLKGKRTGGLNYEKPIKATSINFARWFNTNVNGKDHVILKMNIEGGEYEIMELLLDENLTERIDKCFIQLHAHKFEHGEQRQRFQQIEARFWNEAKCKKYLTNKGSYKFNVQ